MDCSTPASPSFTVSQNLFRFMFSESVMLSNHLILCRPFLLLSSIFPNIRVFSNELTLCIRWPKYWSFSFSIHPFNEDSGLTGWISLPELKSLKALMKLTREGQKSITEGCGHSVCMWVHADTHVLRKWSHNNWWYVDVSVVTMCSSGSGMDGEHLMPKPCWIGTSKPRAP